MQRNARKMLTEVAIMTAVAKSAAVVAAAAEARTHHHTQGAPSPGQGSAQT
jgi:hypothetical protein